MASSTRPRSDRVNIPLGEKAERRLGVHAGRLKTTRTALGRLLIIEGLDRLDSTPKATLSGPKIEPEGAQ